MAWRVRIKKDKLLKKLPRSVIEKVFLLTSEIELLGPVRGNWKNYSKLAGSCHHCHLKSGHPTYVACWEETNKGIEVEVYYVGTHEKAPY